MMVRLRPLLFLLACTGRLLAAGAGEPAAPTEALRLPETLLPSLQPWVDSALKESPRVLQSRLALLAAEAGAQAARAPMGWQVGFGAGADARQEMRRDIPGTHYSYKFSYGVSVTRTLWDWDAKANRARYGELQRQLAEEDLAEARRSLVLELRAQYTGLIIRAAELAQARTEADRLARRLTADEQSATRGEFAALDLADTRLAASESRLTVERLESQWARAQTDFAVLIGLKEFSATGLPAGIPPVPELAASLRSLDPAPAPVVPAALARVDRERAAAKASYDAERVRQRPIVELVAGSAQDEVNYTANIGSKVGVQTNYIGVRLNWNIFDNHATEAATARALAVVKQSDLAYNQAAAALRRQIADGWQDVELGQRELALEEARLVNSTARLEAERRRHESGELSDRDWDLRVADADKIRLAVQRRRAEQLLRVAEYALLLQRGTHSAADLVFP